MAILIGTEDGIYARAGDGPPEPVREGVDVRQFHVHDGRYYAATAEGLLTSADPVREWTSLDAPRADLWAVHTTPTGDLLVGTHDTADLYRSTDGGETWRENGHFAALPRHDEWDNLAATSAGRVRTIGTHERAPHRLVVGVEAEGVYVSEDDGRSWERRVRGLNHDVHEIAIRGKDEFVAATGRGLYRTTDAGRRWQALDTHQDQFWYTYYRAVLAHRGRLYTAGQDRAQARFEDAGQGRIMVSDDGGRSFAIERFPGSDGDYVNAWTVVDGRPVGGTVEGSLLARVEGEWDRIGTVPSSVRTLASTT